MRKMFTVSWKEIGWEKCSGEAHRNPFIDHCGECMPYWEKYPVCPVCGEKLRRTSASFLCDKCSIRYPRFS